MIRVILMKHCNAACCTGAVDASGCRVVVNAVIGTADVIQRLHQFTRLGIDHHQLPGFMLVPTAKFSGVRLDPAAYEQAVMDSV